VAAVKARADRRQRGGQSLPTSGAANVEWVPGKIQVVAEECMQELAQAQLLLGERLHEQAKWPAPDMIGMPRASAMNSLLIASTVPSQIVAGVVAAHLPVRHA